MKFVDKIYLSLHLTPKMRNFARRDAHNGVYQPGHRITSLIGVVDPRELEAPARDEVIVEEERTIAAPEAPTVRSRFASWAPSARWRVVSWLLILLEMQAWVYALKSVALEPVARLSFAIVMTMAGVFLAHVTLRQEEDEPHSPLQRIGAVFFLGVLACVATVIRYKAQAGGSQTGVLALALAVGVAVAVLVCSLGAAACWHHAGKLARQAAVELAAAAKARILRATAARRTSVTPPRKLLPRTRLQELAERLHAIYHSEYVLHAKAPPPSANIAGYLLPD